LEIRAGERLVIVDSGTGIRPLGDMLLTEDYVQGPVNADLFITHTHWDHIMGFPMFNPLFIPETKLRIRGPVYSEDETMETIIGNQLSYRYWPVRQSELAAKIEYGQVMETTLNLGDGLMVHTKYLNHSILCMGYRFEYQGKTIVTAYDHQPFRNLFLSDPQDPRYDENLEREGEAVAQEENEKIHAFFKNADILIHDSQFTSDEYKTHLNWGHSSFDLAFDAAQKAGVKKLVFYHHDPNRSDRELEALEKVYQAQCAGTGLSIVMAREGLSIEA
jgi:ribonuclease BN (tRNA processing enzyme)